MSRRWFAPAKLNLYLHVTGRRADGYHLLDSLVAFASIGDELRVEPAERLSLAVEGPFASSLDGTPNQNLVWRAAEMLAEEAGHAPRVRLTLTKNLPVASGIGGGSSDAAACLRALGAMWELPDREPLDRVAAKLGSDVPACLAARGAWLGGVGEAIEPAGSLPECGLVLVNPGVPLRTPSVYRGFGGKFSSTSRFEVPDTAADLAVLLAARENDLTDAAIRLVPAIGEVLARLGGLDGALLARMSGSGATCFALFATEAEAQAAAATLANEKRSWWIEAGKLRRDDAPLSLEP